MTEREMNVWDAAFGTAMVGLRQHHSSDVQCADLAHRAADDAVTLLRELRKRNRRAGMEVD